MHTSIEPHSSSFKDPSGFIFTDKEEIYRKINQKGVVDYAHLMTSGLYDHLVNMGYLIPHTEISEGIIKPEKILFISYPYEWSYTQLKDAAILTLRIQLAALKFGMSLKDASAFNIQYRLGKPILIDTLSFEVYKEGSPWTAYRQFCQHFLSPLLLMRYLDIRMASLLTTYLDGIPLDLTSKLLPFPTWLSPGILLHVHLHAKSQKRFSDNKGTPRNKALSKNGLSGIVLHLKSIITKLNWNPTGTEWANYYCDTNYSEVALSSKKAIISNWLSEIAPNVIWDFGANTGLFSRIGSDQKIETIAFDIDPCAVEKNYRTVKEKKEVNLLPLVMNFSNPSAALGLSHKERSSLRERGPVDCIFSLALIHHLAISSNIPMARIADFFASIGNNLIIEFVPKSDSKVKQLLSSREDIFDNYSENDFEKSFKKSFEIIDKKHIKDSNRILYRMNKLNK